MENASKALLIAGAILVVIIIIGIGMMILNSSQGIFSSATSTMSTKEKDMFNNQFTIYEGTQNGSTIKGLLSAVISNNNGGESVQKVTVNGQLPSSTSVLPKKDSGEETIITAATYEVKIESKSSSEGSESSSDYTDGLVSNIQVTKK